MRWFENLRIGKKLGLGFITILIITGLIGGMGIKSIQDMKRVDTNLYQESTVPLGEIGQASTLYQQIRVIIAQMIMETDKTKKQQYVSNLTGLFKTLDFKLANFEQTIQSAEGRQEYNKLKENYLKWLPVAQEVARLAQTDDSDKAYVLSSTLGNQFSQELNDSFNKLIELKTSEALKKAEGNSLAAQNSTQDMLILLVGCLLIALGLAAFITRQITTPIQKLRNLMNQVEQGDLTVQDQIHSQDELGQLSLSFNNLIIAIRHMTKEVCDTVVILNQSSSQMLSIAEVVAANSEEMSAVIDNVTSAATGITTGVESEVEAMFEMSGNINSISAATEEISATIDSLASASEQVSVNLAQVTHLVERISEGIHVVAGSAKAVSGSVTNVATAVKEIDISLNDVSKNCEHSMTVAREAEMRAQETDAIIKKLNQLSKQVAKVVNLINDIADQTNMLALNAAIEAAGAGDAGKGFAVVANEVKELAKQTAGATDEIANQIEMMQAEMADAVQAVGGITEIIGKINDNSRNIAAAVTEQSAVVGDISSAVAVAAGKVSLISNEIGDIAEKSQDVASSIGESTLAVKETARSVSDLSSTAGQLAQNTEDVSEQMDQVAKGSKTVANNIEEISRSISEINKASNDTAAKGAEASRTADGLVHVSAKLDQLANRFKVQ